MSWTQHILAGTSAASRCDFHAAEKSLMDALHFAKENYSRNDGRLALTISLLGHIYYYIGDLPRAEKLLEQSLRMHSLNSQSNDPCLMMDLFSLAEIKRYAGHPADASRLYRAALQKFADEQKQNEHVEVLEILQKLVCATTDSVAAPLPFDDAAPLPFDDAAPLPFDDAAPLPSDDAAPPRPPAATAPLPPGLPQMTQTDSTNAGSLDDVWKHQFQTGLASMKMDDAECDELITAYLNLESAYRLATSMFPPNDTRAIATVKALADACTKLKMFEQAEALYGRALSQARSSDSDTEADGNFLRLALALMHIDAGQFQPAKAIFDKEDFGALPSEAEPLRRRVTDAVQLLKVFAQADELLLQAKDAEQSGDMERAAKLANNALSQMKQGLPPGHIENARILRYRSAILSQLGHGEQAEDMKQRAVRIERAHQAKVAEWAQVVKELPKVTAAEGVAVG